MKLKSLKINPASDICTSLEMFCIWGGGGTEKSKRPQVGQHDLPHSEVLQKWPAFTVPARFFHSVPEDA